MEYIAIDVETTGLDPYKGARIFSFATCDWEGQTEVYRFDAVDGDQCRKKLQEILWDTSIAKICHNYHFEYAMFSAEGYIIPEETEWHDTMIMSQMVDNLSPSHALDELAFKWCRYPLEQDNEVSRAAKIYGTYDKIPKKLMDVYQRADVERTMLLYRGFEPLVKRDERVWADYLNELELVIHTVSMESRGIMLARNEANKLMAWMSEEIKRIEKETFSIFGGFVNLNSGKQVAQLLFKDLALSPISFTGAGNPSVDKESIEELGPQAKSAGPHVEKLFDLILQQRSYVKGTAMIKSYLTAADDKDIIRPHINTNRARTGRESAENPNMQNISKDAALKTKFPVPARKCFRSRPGHILLLGDYAGIELRLIIEHTQDPEMVELLRTGGDPHIEATKLLYGSIYRDEERAILFCAGKDENFKDSILTMSREEAVKKARKMLRTAAKNAHFALAYGAGAPKIAETLMISELEAIEGLTAYKLKYPKIGFFTQNTARIVDRYGFVTTSFGRRLYLRRDKPYSGSNYLIQGTAAGILKRAQNKVTRYLKEELGEGAQILLPIHDEIIVEVSRKYLKVLPEMLEGMAEQMTTIPEIKVPLEVEWKMTPYTWDKAKEYHYEKA